MIKTTIETVINNTKEATIESVEKTIEMLKERLDELKNKLISLAKRIKERIEIFIKWRVPRWKILIGRKIESAKEEIETEVKVLAEQAKEKVINSFNGVVDPRPPLIGIFGAVKQQLKQVWKRIKNSFTNTDSNDEVIELVAIPVVR
jgi:hypothetical protein